MATYKVIQDIEADDKLIWMFSFRQFVYAFIAVIFLFFSYMFYAKHVAFLDILSLPVVLFTGVLAFPFGKDQPTEVWVLAKVRFFIKPRRRIWAQGGERKLVTITAPKKIEVNLTDNLSQTEVKSKLQALANTIDTRGWAIKNINTNINNSMNSIDEDRLISPVVISTDPSEQYVSSSEDIMDERSNPLAQKIQTMINVSETEHKKEIIEKLQDIQKQQLKTAPIVEGKVSKSIPTDQIDENTLNNQLKNMTKNQHLSLEHLREVNRLQTEAKRKKENITPAQAKTNQLGVKEKPNIDSNPDIIKLANRDDLNITVLANEINLKNSDSKTKEVVISLH